MFTRRELKILDDVMPEMTRRAAADDMKDLEGGEVGIFQRLRVFCLGTNASHAHLVSRSRRSSEGSPQSTIKKERPELRVTFNVSAATPVDLESASLLSHAPTPPPHPFHSHSNSTNAETHVSLPTAPC